MHIVLYENWEIESYKDVKPIHLQVCFHACITTAEQC